jgi:serine/threonine protein kinase
MGEASASGKATTWSFEVISSATKSCVASAERAMLEPTWILGPQSASVSGSFDLQISITRTGIVTGTPAYMAPEQHLGEPGGPASDQFAFCVSLWEALYRQRPFAGDNFFEVADAIVEGRLVAPPGHVRVPGWINNLLERGLASEPEHRHPSMRSLLASFVFSFKVMHGMA